MRAKMHGEFDYKGKGALAILQVTGWRAASEIERQAGENDVVIVDLPSTCRDRGADRRTQCRSGRRAGATEPDGCLGDKTDSGDGCE